LDFKWGVSKPALHARLNARSIDFSRCVIQIGDEPPPTFHVSTLKRRITSGQGRENFHIKNSIRAGKFHVNNFPAGLTGNDDWPNARHCPANLQQVLRFMPGEIKRHWATVLPVDRRQSGEGFSTKSFHIQVLSRT